MSSILKALKKVESDAATRRPDEVRIDAEILRAESPARFSSSGVLLVSLLLMAFGAGGTYLYMTRDKAPEQTRENSSIVPNKQQPLPEASKTPVEHLPPEIIVVPAQQQTLPERKTVNKHSPPPESNGAAAVVKRPEALQPQPPPHREVPLPVAHPLSSVPALRVNGIAFQDDSTGAVAMINEQPLAKGGIINGVTIEEIYKNRVKFNYNGELFEIPLGQSNR